MKCSATIVIGKKLKEIISYNDGNRQQETGADYSVEHFVAD